MAAVELSLLVLKTRRVDDLRVFYEALGVALLEERHGNGPVHYAGRVGSTTLEIYPLAEAGGNAEATTRLGFMVEKLLEVMTALHSLGSVVVANPQSTEWGYRAVVRDPDGRAVELYQR